MDTFYRAFEDEFRGKKFVIKSRLAVYSTFIKPLKKIFPKAKALDLGCGRGEWLELMRDYGLSAKGIDSDAGMLQSCRESGLDVEQIDLSNYLAELPDESLEMITAFHVVEHLPFDLLRHIIKEAHRVLKPGGLLILETPNPENIQVGTWSFYLDPSHQKPLPSRLLNFLASYEQFGRTRTIYLNGPIAKDSNVELSLMDVFESVSFDYAVIAQKDAPANILTEFDAAFEQPSGMTLHEIVMAYENQVKTKFLQAKQKSDNKIEWLEKKLATLQEQIEGMRFQVQVNSSNTSFKQRGLLRLGRLYFITLKIFRIMKRLIKGAVHGIYTNLKRMITRIIKAIVQSTIARPSLRQKIVNFLDRFPLVKLYVRKSLRRLGIIEKPSARP
jgi:SAM-dependent methyltransferase